jgi:fumarate reductase subunit D
MSSLALSGAAAMRNHPAYWAFVVHRVSGVGLALFLPLHFWVLALMLEPARADAFFRWAEQPLVKLAETVLVVLLAVHLAGGLRLLALEFLPWRDTQKTRIAVAFGFALAAGLVFLLAAF